MQIEESLERFILFSALFKLLYIILYLFLAWLVHRLSWRIAGLILRLNDLTIPARLPPQLSRFASAVSMSKIGSNPV